MIPLIKLKKDVQFNGQFTKIVDAMKGIAAARFHQLERQLTLFEPFAQGAATLLAGIDVGSLNHPLLRPTVKRTAAVLVTSDEGFLGGLNAQVVAAGLEEAGPEVWVTVIGNQGRNSMRGAGYAVTQFPGVVDATRAQAALTVRDHLIQQVKDRVIGKIIVAYPRALSFAVQQVQVETLVPCTGWVTQATKDQPRSAVPTEWESDPADVVAYVVGHWIAHRLEEIFALARLAEFSARAVHLEGSYQELLRQGRKLKFQYMRSRHEVIDRSIREVSASQLLFKHLPDEEDADGAR